MKVLILAELVAHSGVGVYIQSLTKNLLDNGDKVIVLSSSFSNDVDERAPCCSFKPLKMKNFFKNYKIFKEIVEKYDVDVVHIQHRVVGIYPLLYNLFKRKVAVTYIVHTVLPPRIGGGGVKRLLTNSGDRTIAISSEVKECCLDTLKIKAEKVRLIYNGVADETFVPVNREEKAKKRKALNIPDDKLVVCMNGRIDHVKGHDILLNAIALLPQEQRDRIHVVCAGETKNNSFYDELCESIDQFGLSSAFTFLGWSKPQDVLSVSDLCVMPSRREGFPLSCIESFFMRVPLVRSCTGGSKDMRDCCVLLAKNDAVEWANAISRFMDAFFGEDERLWQEYRNRVDVAYRWAKNNCTVHQMAVRTRAVFEEAINEY